MPRVMTIWLPRWPVQRRLLDRPELRKLPVFICRRERRGLLTVASWAWAEPPRRRQAAIRPGMSLAEAMSVLALAYGSRACHVAEVDTDDPAADLAALEQLARWCRRFAATVGIEQPPAGLAEAATAPECLLLDVTGTAGFFGGEAALARTAAWTLAARRLHARVAIADTPAASWAAAHHTDLVARAEHGSPATAGGAGRLHLPQAAAGPHRRWAIAAPGSQHLRAGAGAVLAGLPLESLRLERTVCDMLHEVGIDTLGGMLRLSAKSLAARFPPSLARRLAEFTGARAEPIISPRGGELPQATHDFDLPLPLTAIDDAGIASLLEQLVGQCIPPLAARGEGILTVQTRFEPAAAAAGAGSLPPAVIDISLFRPSMSVRHVVELIRLRMGRAKLPREIAAISVEVVAAGLAGCRQRSLFDAGSGEQPGGSAGAHVDVGQLIDRLAGRLGRPAVFEPKPVADPQPEHAWLPQPPHGAGNGRSRPATPPGRRTASVAVHVRPAAEGLPRNRVRRQGVATRSGFAATGRRPIWMPPRPLPLEPLAAGMVSVAPDGPPVRFRFGGVVHRVMQAHGPERIETAWWRGPTVRRDYYIVETESGARFWLFRRLGRPPRKARGEWYLHGVFA